MRIIPQKSSKIQRYFYSFKCLMDGKLAVGGGGRNLLQRRRIEFLKKRSHCGNELPVNVRKDTKPESSCFCFLNTGLSYLLLCVIRDTSYRDRQWCSCSGRFKHIKLSSHSYVSHVEKNRCICHNGKTQYLHDHQSIFFPATKGF